jgi:ABC-type bacteriocin/lantibiotic exporter with double-glycine peptidase domain
MHSPSESDTTSVDLTESCLKVLVEILEHSVEELRLGFDRAAIRRAVSEAIRTWPGKVEQRWWKWLTEAGASLDLRVSVVEGKLDEVLLFVHEGIHVAAYLQQSSEPWLIVDAFRRGKYRIFRPDTQKPKRHVRRGELKRILRPANDSGLIRVVTLDPALTCDSEHHERESRVGRTLKPLERLMLIIRAEWSDIWVVLVFAVLSGILALATPMAVQVMVSIVAFGRFLQPVIVLSLILLGLTAFWAVLRLWETYIAEVLQRRLFARVVHDLSYRLPRLRQDALNGSYGPELTNRFFDIVTLQKVTTQFLLDGVDLVIVTIIGMVVLAVYHPLLLGLNLALLLSIAFIVFALGRGGVRSSIQESKYKYYTAAWLQEITRTPLTFKLDNASEYAEEKAEHLVSDYLEHRRLHFRVLFRQVAFALVLYALTGSVLLGVGGWLVIQGQLTLGQLVAAEMIVAIIVGAFTKMGKHLEAYYDLLAGVDKLGVLFDLPLESQQGLMRLPETRPAQLSVRHVSVHFDTRQVLQDISFEIESGDRIALTGPAGSGKSTLVDVLYGLRIPLEGRVLLDDHELTEVRPDVWRRHVMLLRRAEVFHGTVTENIHMEHPDIDVRLVRETCERLGLMDEHCLPDGLETILSSTGAPLSDSQICRLVLARALVHQPRLLVIDGLLDTLPLDVLDQVLDNLFDPNATWTLIVISSRPRVLQRCQREISLTAYETAQQL